jgi:copper chaperone NosL
MKRHVMLSGLLAAAVAAGCTQRENAEPPPPPATLTEAAVGYYCGMTITEHKGPKAQIFVEGEAAPKWFAQVRDGVVFQRSPEETATILAFYVTARSQGEGAAYSQWIPADTAYFVIESGERGGMGAPEAIPFATETAASAYVTEYGGKIVRLREIPDEYILAPFEATEPEAGEGHSGHH